MFLVPMSRRSNELSRLFDETFDRFFNPAAGTTAGSEAFSPALDVTESKEAWTVRLDLPGVAKGDVKIAINGAVVSVEAEVRKDEEKKEGDRIVYRERTASRYLRSFTLPSDVDQALSSAKLDNGVLTLKLGKKSAAAVAQLTVS